MVAADVDRFDVPGATEVTMEEVRASAERIFGSELGAHDPVWMTRVGNASRLAARYRKGRRLLAGDAAHIDPPQGGQGLNLGVQDARNLGWKLAAHVRRVPPPWLLEGYEQERRPVGDAVVRGTGAQDALASATTAEGLALRELVAEILGDHPSVSRSMVQKLVRLTMAYPSREATAHPLTGWRVPDVELSTDSGSVHLFAALRSEGFVWLASDAAPDLPRGGADAALIRLDGYVAWAGDATDAAGASVAWGANRVTERREPHA